MKKNPQILNRTWHHGIKRDQTDYFWQSKNQKAEHLLKLSLVFSETVSMWVGGRFGELLTHAVNTAETEDGGGGRQRAWKITVQELKSVAKPWFNLNFSARRESWKQKTFSYIFLACCAALFSEYLLLPHPGNTERHRCHLKQQELCLQMFFCIKRIQEVVGRSNESAKLKHHKLVYLYALKNQTKTSNNAQQLNVCAQLTLILMLKS